MNNINLIAFSQQVEEARALCKQCGVGNKGSKADLVMRLCVKMWVPLVSEMMWNVEDNSTLLYLVVLKKLQYHYVVM